MRWSERCCFSSTAIYSMQKDETQTTAVLFEKESEKDKSLKKSSK